MNAVLSVNPISPSQGERNITFIWGKMTLKSSTMWTMFQELPQFIWKSRQYVICFSVVLSVKYSLILSYSKYQTQNGTGKKHMACFAVVCDEQN